MVSFYVAYKNMCFIHPYWGLYVQYEEREATFIDDHELYNSTSRIKAAAS